MSTEPPANSTSEPAPPLPEPEAPLVLPPRRVAPEAPPAERDPEFDTVINPATYELDHSPEAYLRLVANPFLGLFGVFNWVAGLIALFLGYAWPFTPAAAILLIASLWLLPAMFQYHCLDCGRTGRLMDWRRHLCPKVVERHMDGRTRRFRGPTPTAQVILWLWAVMMLFVALHALGVRAPRIGPAAKKTIETFQPET